MSSSSTTAPATHLWIDSTNELRAALRSHEGAPFYALDTEFVSGTTYRPILAVVQLAIEGKIYLVDALACDLAVLAELLAGPGTMIAHAAQADLELLEHHCKVKPTKLFDTQIAGQLLGLRSPSLATSVSVELGVELDKSERLTDWTARPLPKPARRYAALDVAYLEELYQRYTAQLDALGRVDWCAEECGRLRRAPRAERSADDAWLKVKGASGLGGETRKLLRAAAAWRDELAQRLNQIPHRVIADDALVELAKRPPTTTAQLKKLRAGARLRDGELSSLLAVLAAAPAGPAADPVREPRLSRDLEALTNLLATCVLQLGRDAGIDPTLIATKADITTLVAKEPSRLDVGWRALSVAPALRAIIDGQATIRVTDAGRSLEITDVSSGAPLGLIRPPAA